MASVSEKLSILADAAKYDASCSSSGSKRANKDKGLGNSDGMGICHSYTEDGRCVSLLKILFSNVCIYDCAYCVSRRSNDVQRASFTVQEVVALTLNFYRRNFIEGLFLSSGIFKSADATMEKLVRVARTLRNEHNFNGYIHIKAIPGASEDLLHEAGLYADRLSVNIEIPSEPSLQKVAPEKNYSDIITPMNFLSEERIRLVDERKVIRSAPRFMPAGQSTQLIVGASPDSDWQILNLADGLYKQQKLKRVYYSGYVPIATDDRVPSVSAPPLLRENRVYQADWLLRFYRFSLDEIVTPEAPDLDLEVDPKLGYALRNPQAFPVDINRADYEMILRVPGIGVKSARKIVSARRFQRITWDNLKALGVATRRARYFISCPGLTAAPDWDTPRLRSELIAPASRPLESPQLSLFG
ncbi:putative DNA modification/repair radical SAM protein [Halopseudomonas pertucinogena]|uniref:DNA modification/repair radical SAM protein n=1 Tax=Halopseudomonas pertucinogena TaxID=86175 RepID=A0ABQ2CU13_9GAMM|nr:putative DNA modification/repair radical SAM protein [Halopseudomonas pertucinogena]GGJ02365.1 putative DNA modification/repair radical SAM protein [Halopseudomonas pertucinogena]